MRLAELGEYVLEPIEVEPFTKKVDGVTFGWKVGHFGHGTCSINVEPGDVIAFSAPWTDSSTTRRGAAWSPTPK
jgi:hypothetical protein